jgi:hypothetical protein
MKPEQLSNPNFSALTDQCQWYLDLITNDPEAENQISNATHYIFESAMEAVFGKDVWKYVNEVLK